VKRLNAEAVFLGVAVDPDCVEVDADGVCHGVFFRA
jgi:hypothetical protein